MWRRGGTWNWWRWMAKWVVEDGRPTRVDADTIRREAAIAIENLWQRARAG